MSSVLKSFGELSSKNFNNLRSLTTSIKDVNTNSSSSSNSENYDVVVVGGGIVGMATARELLLRHQPNLKMALVEKEDALAKHQSGHNSGVIHAGIYYQPGSLKAKLCVQGLRLAYKYCDEKEIPYKKVGKLIVATNKKEIQRLYDLKERAIQNEVPDIKMLKGIKEIQAIEPYCRGLEALWSPQTGIVDWAIVTYHYGMDFEKMGGDIYYNFEVTGFKESTNPNYPVMLKSKDNRSIQAKYVLTCGGLQSDLISELSGCSKHPRIVPFRGEYLLLNDDKCKMIKGNIYPVPDPRFPFLGVHFTPRMDGSVWLGPNAVLAFKREGYTWFDFNARDLLTTLTYPGFRRMALRYLSYGLKEAMKSAFVSLQVRELQKFVPEITIKDVQRGPSGVRAQALDEKGNLVDDFYFDNGVGDVGKRIIHCRNAPSPGATSSLAIAQMVCDKIEKEFQLV